MLLFLRSFQRSYVRHTILPKYSHTLSSSHRRSCRRFASTVHCLRASVCVLCACLYLWFRKRWCIDLFVLVCWSHSKTARKVLLISILQQLLTCLVAVWNCVTCFSVSIVITTISDTRFDVKFCAHCYACNTQTSPGLFVLGFKRNVYIYGHIAFI